MVSIRIAVITRLEWAPAPDNLTILPTRYHICSPAALQRLLVHLFSLDAVTKAASFAGFLREDSDPIAVALAGQGAGKQPEGTPFMVPGHAIKILLTSEAKDVLSEAEVISTFVSTGRLLHQHVELLAAENAGLAPQ